MGTTKTQFDQGAAKSAPSPASEKLRPAFEQQGGHVHARRIISPLSAPSRGPPPMGVVGYVSNPPNALPEAPKRAQMSAAIQRQFGNIRMTNLPGCLQAKISVGEPGGRYEQEADEAASRVVSGQKVARISRIAAGGLSFPVSRQKPEEEEVQMRQAQRQPEADAAAQEQTEEELLQGKLNRIPKQSRIPKHAPADSAGLPSLGKPSAKLAVPANRIIQRYAFIKEQQVDLSAKGLTPEMKAMVADTSVRDYKDNSEFKRHATQQTDYLGNLIGPVKKGTWLKFSPTGMNVLGEKHTEVTFSAVAPSVGTKSFIDEQFSSDDLSKNPELKAAYEAANLPEFKKFGIENEKNKQPFGAESLIPKMGYALAATIPYFDKTSPISDLTSTIPNPYAGKPFQRYLKLAWGYSRDNAASVAKNKASASPKMKILAAVHKSVEKVLDPFITALIVDGFLGDELKKPKNSGLFRPLLKFANAFTQAIVELAAKEKSSRLSPAERKKLSSVTTISSADKKILFGDWRNFVFEDVVKAAAKRGVRYAGMGWNHLDYLGKNSAMPPNSHPFDMVTVDIDKFVALTTKLRSKAKKQTLPKSEIHTITKSGGVELVDSAPTANIKVSAGTEVKVLDSSHLYEPSASTKDPHVGHMKIHVLSGSESGVTGWVHYYYVKPK